MKVTITPSVATGTVIAPPSKSVAHRALICGALSEKSMVSGVSYSQDVEATLRCLKAMGARVDRMADGIVLGGLHPEKIPPHTVLDCGESGSTLRFLLPLCLLSSVPVRLTGSRHLFARPLDVYEQLCHERNLLFVRTEDSVTVCGPLSPGIYRVRGDLSSQFISGLILALPLLSGNSILEVTDGFESKPYVNLTRVVQSRFGINVLGKEKRFSICGNSTYAPTTYHVEGDFSNAAVLDAFNLLGGDVKVLGLPGESAQGDIVYRRFYQQIMAGMDRYDLSDCPDLGPIMFALAAIHGSATFCGTARLRLKESDRITSMISELAKFGIAAAADEDMVKIYGGHLQPPCEPLCSHNDHRIAMALCLLSSVVGGTIEGVEAVEKSYPEFFDDLRALSIKLEFHD